MEESMFSRSLFSPKNKRHQNRVSKPLNILTAVFCIILIGLTSACGPTPEELSAFQTVTAMAAFTPTPQPSPTPAGITPDHDLTAILASAADGDVITLAPGVFSLAQGLNLDKSLTLIGAGDDQTTITTSKPYQDVTTMLMFSGTGTLTFKGIKIEYTGSDPAALIYMQSGTLWLEDCILTGATLSASGKQVGAISMANDAAAVIRGSHIAGSLNRLDPENPLKIPGGIFLAGTNKLTLESTSITDSYIGVYAYGQAQVTITDSHLTNNYTALTLLETATASISGSTFSNCSGSCIVTANDSQASISDNTFSDSPDALAIQITANSNVQINNNNLSSVKSAILFMDNASGEAVGNTIEAFTSIGIVVQNESAPMITNNIVILSQATYEDVIGISYQDSASGEARGNQFTNLYLAISLDGDAAPLLDSNTIEACRTGISYVDNTAGTANLNVISNGETGIMIKSPASPTITNNTIQAFFTAMYTEPEDWIEKLTVIDNILTSGEPEILIVTVTPMP